MQITDITKYPNYSDGVVRPQPADPNLDKVKARATAAEDLDLLQNYKNRRWKIDEDVKPRVEQLEELIQNCDAQIKQLKESNKTLEEIENPSTQVENRILGNMDKIAGYIRDKERLEPKLANLRSLLAQEEQKLVDTWESPLMQSRLKRVKKEQEALAV